MSHIIVRAQPRGATGREPRRGTEGASAVSSWFLVRMCRGEL